MSMGQEITPGHIGGRRVLSPLRQPYSKIDDEHDNDSNNNKTHDLAMLLHPHRFIEHEQALASSPALILQEQESR